MKIIWASDVHLNFLNSAKKLAFYQKLKEAGGDAVVISGDVAESQNIVPIIKGMEDLVGIPVYFVLGNHDFYTSRVASVRKHVRKFNWLPKYSGVPLSESTVLLGVDGWGDCRYGDFENSRLVMNDWLHIEDLIGKREEKLKEALQLLADKDARALKRKVLKAVKTYKKIIIVTHVPPFEEACLYAGRKSTPGGLPFFASKTLGDSILPIVKKNPQVEFLWLCGHTHHRAIYKPCDNMTVKVAHSEYFCPQIEEVINVE